ncbi:GcrA family cell cycle regulator, partial [Klebsiella pneumoniae]|uniref:GcrA family cell cycle regulator n=1 Tax=Klebsiella pneumoniae TaxID=573 RepID=UPI003C6D194A
SLGSGRCCWPIGEPGTRTFRFCDDPNEAGRPYCPDHCERSYVRKTRRDKASGEPGVRAS